jgi:hypothetical protein
MTAARKQPDKKRRPPLRSNDRKLRELVAIAYADPTIGADAHIENLHKLVAWIKTGHTPTGIEHKFTPRLVEGKAS